MDLFKAKHTASSEQLQKIKQWVGELLQLDSHIPISVSQLHCHEPDCPPVETVIAVMTKPTQTFKIHQPARDLDYQQLREFLSSP